MRTQQEEGTMSIVIRVLSCIVLAAVSGTAMAQAGYPNRPIRIIVAFPPGASTDIVARLVGAKLGETLGQNVVIENRPGAGSNIGSQAAKRANADGYTLLMNSSAMAVNVSLYRTPGYTMADFAPVLQGPTTANLIMAHPSVKANTLQEVIAMARAAPLNYGSSGIGTTPHLDMEMIFRSLAKVSVTHVPYTPPTAAAAIAGNQVPIGCTTIPPAVPHLQAGRVKPIAVTTAARSSILPNVPTVAESGFRRAAEQGDEPYPAAAGREEEPRLPVAGIHAQHAAAVRRRPEDGGRALREDGQGIRRESRVTDKWGRSDFHYPHFANQNDSDPEVSPRDG
jgi:tripartite-type tricarboxylate transporter receptor subunit TctC